jgi:hypothetical protein
MLENVGSRLGVGPATSASFSSHPADRITMTMNAGAKRVDTIGSSF